MTDTTSAAPAVEGARSPDGTGAGDRFETLVVPVGPSDGDRIEALAATAAETGGMLQTAVHVVHVFSPSRYETACERLGVDDDPDAVARRVDPVRELTRELAGPLRDWGMPLTVAGRVSERPSDGIVAAAEAVDAKRILVGGRRRTPTGKAVFGSTAQKVLLEAPCPVTFVKDEWGPVER